MVLDLRQGIAETEQYKAWKFPGGEIHFKLKNVIVTDNLHIITNLNTAEDIIFLLIVTDTIKKDCTYTKLTLKIPYMPYQQADRNFSSGECFSLKTITNLINSMKFDKVYIFDPHSDVTPALIDNCVVIDNTEYIIKVLRDLHFKKHIESNLTQNIDDLVIVSPDAGAYKKIFKLCENIGFKGEIVTCSKSRNHDTGVLTIQVPKFDEYKSVLIIDDICLAGNTFLNIRKEIPNEKVFLAVSHGIFNDNIDKLQEAFDGIYSTNSRGDEIKGEKFNVIKI
jgi:ribose-phosphate pyrophosphokinase